MYHLRSKLSTSRKQAAVVAGLAGGYDYQYGGKKHKSATNETTGQVEKFYNRPDVVYIMPGKEMSWQFGQKRVEKEFGHIF